MSFSKISGSGSDAPNPDLQVTQGLQSLEPRQFNALFHACFDPRPAADGEAQLSSDRVRQLILQEPAANHLESALPSGEFLEVLSTLAPDQVRDVLRDVAKTRFREGLARWQAERPEEAADRRRVVIEMTRGMEDPSWPANVTDLSLENLNREVAQSASISSLPEEISMLVNLKTLNLTGNTALIRLPASLSALPALIHLILTGCTSLQTLAGMPALPALTGLSLTGCTSLQTLEGMPAVPALTGLSLTGCTSLQTLEGMPALPALTHLSLRGCTSLQTLEGMPALSPACRVITPDHLQNAPQAPLAMPPVFAQQPPFSLKRSDLTDHPVQVLRNFGEAIQRGAQRVLFEGEQGLDAGGLRRELVSQLVPRLFTESDGERPLPAFGSVAEATVLPHIEESDAPHQADFVALGRVLQFATRAQVHATIGPLFDLRFFASLHKALEDAPKDPAEVAVLGALAYNRAVESWLPKTIKELSQLPEHRRTTLREQVPELWPEIRATEELLSVQTGQDGREQRALATLYLQAPLLAEAMQAPSPDLSSPRVLELLEAIHENDAILSDLSHQFETARKARVEQIDREIEKREASLKKLKPESPAAKLHSEAVARLRQERELPQGEVHLTPEQRRILLEAIATTSARSEGLSAKLADLVSNQSQQRLLEELRSSLLVQQSKESTYQSVGRAITAIAEGFREVAGQSPTPSLEDLEGQLVGRATAADLVGSFETMEGVSPQTVKWLTQWLNEADDRERALFCKAVTGSPTLRPGDKIRIQHAGNPESLPATHTCSNQIDLPDYTDYETFKKKLAVLLEDVGAGGGFGIV